jgi:hypothetical protein
MAPRRKAETYEGKVHPRCGTSTRYKATGRCVRCERLSGRINKANQRKRDRGEPVDTGCASGVTRIEKPSRKKWPVHTIEHGERVYVDPMVYLDLADEGKYE